MNEVRQWDVKEPIIIPWEDEDELVFPNWWTQEEVDEYTERMARMKK